MTREEKLALIEECMDLDEGTLKPEDEVDSYEEWDSVTMLTIISEVDEKLQITLTGKQLKEVKTIADVLALME